MSAGRSVYGIGNPLMDVICRVEYSALEKLGYAPGSMNLVDHAKQEEILATSAGTKMLAGGSCANTIRAFAFLAAGKGTKPAYTGGVGTDETGRAFHDLLQIEGVESRLGRKTTPTGRSVILVTPDGQRTMFTFLGACRELTTEDIDRSLLSRTGVFHTTGYMWDTKKQEEAARWAMSAVNEQDTIVSFDIADPFVVARFRDKLLGWLPGNVDILFANQEELSALVGIEGPEESIVESAFSIAPTIVMKVGRRGAYLGEEGRVTLVPGNAVDPLDTTGAGDSFAGGFLHALANGGDSRSAVRLANAIAAQVVGVDGCDYSRLDREAVLAAV